MDGTANDAKAIFIGALDHDPGADRTAYLDAACGNRRELRRRVEALLAAHECAGEMFGSSPPAIGDATLANTGALATSPTVEPTQFASTGGPSVGVTIDLNGGPNAPSATVHTGERQIDDGLPRGTPIRYFGDYEIVSELGRGGMGVVYKARQVTLNRPVALKLLRAGLMAGDEELRRFQNEAETVAMLDHPGIVPVYEVGEHEGRLYFSMKLIEGCSLVNALSNYKDDPRAAAQLLVKAAEAVAHAHERGILHRDLKPANLLIDSDGRPHVTDFGLAKRLVEDVELTQSGAIMGTPAYMSPEQATGRRRAITMATDVYGLGAVLYALLVGHAPFDAESVVDTLQAVKEQPPKPLRRLNAKVPRNLERICLKCLEKEPRHRYAMAQALADDLHNWLENRPIAARRVGSLERAWLWCRRRPALAGLLAALVLAFVGTTILSIIIARQQADRARIERLLRSEAITERDRSARQAYISSVNLAWHEWQDANPARVRDLLDATRPAGESTQDLRSFEWFYLDRLGRAPIWDYVPKEASLGSSLAFGPAGTWVAVALAPRAREASQIAILDAHTGKEIRRISPPLPRFGRIAATPDGRQIFCADTKGTVRFLDAETGDVRQTLFSEPPQAAGAAKVVFSHDRRQIARLLPRSTHESSLAVIEIWDVAQKTKLKSFSIPTNDYAGGPFSVSPDGHHFAAVSAGLKIWNTTSGKLEHEIKSAEIFGEVAYSPNGQTLAAAAFTGWIGLWNSETGAQTETLTGHRGEINRIDFSPDGRQLVSGGRDRVVRIWDVPSGRLHHELRGHESQVWDVGFARDGRHVASVGFHDGEVKFWDSDRAPEAIELKTGPIDARSLPTFGLTFSDNGQVLFAAQAAGAIEAWDLDQNARRFQIKSNSGKGRGWVAVNPSSNLLATLSDQRSIILRSPSDGAEIRTLDSSEGSRVFAFSPDGRFLVGGGDQVNTIRLWEVGSGRLVGIFDGHEKQVECLAFSPDGAKIASGSHDTTVRIWDVAARKAMLVYRRHAAPIATVAFHPDGQTVASASMDSSLRGEVHLWGVQSGKDSIKLRGLASFARRVSFLADGKRLVALGDDGVLKLWDTVSGQEAFSVAAHSRNGLGLAVSSDGQRLATSGAEWTIRVWDSAAQTARPVPSPDAR